MLILNFKKFFYFLNIFFNYEHNKIIRLIIVERRILIDVFYGFINIRAKMYNGV